MQQCSSTGIGAGVFCVNDANVVVLMHLFQRNTLGVSGAARRRTASPDGVKVGGDRPM